MWVACSLPLQVPPVKPVVVTIANHAAFGNGPPPFTQTVNLPSGQWADVVLDVTGSASEIVYEPLPVDDPMQLWRAGPGCETGPIAPHPTQPDTVWGACKGQFSRMSLRTGQEQQFWIGAQSLYGNANRDLLYRRDEHLERSGSSLGKRGKNASGWRSLLLPRAPSGARAQWRPDGRAGRSPADFTGCSGCCEALARTSAAA